MTAGQPQTASHGIILSSRALVIGGFGLVAGGMLILVGAVLWSDQINSTYAARADMAYAQALQVGQLEAAASGLDPRDPAAQGALSQQAEAYLATIDAEARLLGQDAGDQMAERARAEGLIAAIMAGDAGEQIRVLAHGIAAGEVEEAAQARQRAQEVSQRARTFVIVAATLFLLAPLALAIMLQRLLVTPLTRLGEAAEQVAGERGSPPLPQAGLREIRQLTARFNAMAEAVDARVAERTAALARANADLAAVDQRRRLFLAKVSHELRTPVTAIRGEAEVARCHARTPEDLHEALGHIEQSSVFLSRRLDDLMLLARAQDARLPMGEGLADPFAAARNACDIAAAYARSNAVAIADEGLSVATARVRGDGDRLQQAIAAVIDNAIKFSPPSGTVSVIGSVEDSAAVIRIRDQGPGVPDEELGSIFDPYVQGQSGRALGGTGLGLSLARWIVEAYDGAISAGSGPSGEGDEGLCVTLRLPITA